MILSVRLETLVREEARVTWALCALLDPGCGPVEMEAALSIHNGSLTYGLVLASRELDAAPTCPDTEPWRELSGLLTGLFREPHWRRLEVNGTRAPDGVQGSTDDRPESRNAGVLRAGDSPGEDPRSESASSRDSLLK